MPLCRHYESLGNVKMQLVSRVSHHHRQKIINALYEGKLLTIKTSLMLSTVVEAMTKQKKKEKENK